MAGHFKVVPCRLVHGIRVRDEADKRADFRAARQRRRLPTSKAAEWSTSRVCSPAVQWDERDAVLVEAVPYLLVHGPPRVELRDRSARSHDRGRSTETETYDRAQTPELLYVLRIPRPRLDERGDAEEHLALRGVERVEERLRRRDDRGAAGLEHGPDQPRVDLRAR